MAIIKIIVVIINNGWNIEYYIETENGTKEYYTEQTVPHSIIQLMNWNRITYHETNEIAETFIYDFTNI